MNHNANAEPVSKRVKLEKCDEAEKELEEEMEKDQDVESEATSDDSEDDSSDSESVSDEMVRVQEDGAEDEEIDEEGDCEDESDIGESRNYMNGIESEEDSDSDEDPCPSRPPVLPRNELREMFGRTYHSPSEMGMLSGELNRLERKNETLQVRNKALEAKLRRSEALVRALKKQIAQPVHCQSTTCSGGESVLHPIWIAPAPHSDEGEE